MKTKAQKRLEAEERQKAYNALTVPEKLRKLGDYQAEKQRKKLYRLLYPNNPGLVQLLDFALEESRNGPHFRHQ